MWGGEENMLTARQVLHAKPGRHSDGQGLHLLVKPSGSKSWVLRVQFNGRRRDYGLGSCVMESVDVDVPLERNKALTLGRLMRSR